MFQQMGAQKAEDLDAGKRLRGLESGSRLTASSESIEDTAARLEDASPEQVLEWAFTEFGDQLTIATGFGTEGSAIIDMAVKICGRPNIFFLDTGFLFPETYDLRRRIEARYGIEIRAVSTALTPEAQAKLYGPQLWASNPDLCCKLRKTEPLKVALAGAAAWATGIRRDQTPERAAAGVVEWDSRWDLVKINPLATWTRREVWRYVIRNDVPYNPLQDQGYKSIGCTHCTLATGEGDDERAGRWAGHQKRECGLHGGNALIAMQPHELAAEFGIGPSQGS